MTRLNGKELAEQFSDFVNSSHDKNEFADTVLREHRFLQQEMFLTMFKCIEGWAELDGTPYYDDRNKYAVIASKTMLEALKDAKLY